LHGGGHGDRQAARCEDGDRRRRARAVILRRDDLQFLVGDDLESGRPERAADGEEDVLGRG
jgi:hypothetical protein